MSGHIRERSRGSFELRYRVAGRVRTETFRGTKTTAKARMRELQTAVDQGMHVTRSKLEVGAHVKARIAHWQTSKRINARCAEHYQDLATHILRGLGDIPLQKLNTIDVECWHAEMMTRGLAPRTVRAVHSLLARALADGVRHRLLAHNAAKNQGPPAKEPSCRAAAPNGEQVKTLLAKLVDDPWRAPVIVALYCGLRRGEQLALRWSVIDLDKARLRVVAALDETRAGGVTVKPPKTDAGHRTISLPAIVVEALRVHRRQQLERCLLLGLGRPPDDALVFPGDRWGLHAAARVLAALGASGGPSRDAGADLAHATPRPRQHADRGVCADHHGRCTARSQRPRHHAQGVRAPVRQG
jgi:integrase